MGCLEDSGHIPYITASGEIQNMGDSKFGGEGEGKGPRKSPPGLQDYY